MVASHNYCCMPRANAPGLDSSYHGLLHQRLRVGSRLRLTYTAQGEQVSAVLLP